MARCGRRKKKIWPFSKQQKEIDELKQSIALLAASDKLNRLLIFALISALDNEKHHSTVVAREYLKQWVVDMGSIGTAPVPKGFEQAYRDALSGLAQTVLTDLLPEKQP